MRAYERFMKYITFDTASCESSPTCPSTPGQKVLGAYLVEEMLKMGVSDARMDDNGYVYGSIPANCDGQPAIGLIAHMDTVDSVPCMPMNAGIIENYDGGVVALKNGATIDPALYTELNGCVGKDLIVTDGNTILGADDKAGIAEILTLAERLLSPENTVKHGKICIGFTPDEEIGRGADLFDVAGFGADFAYTVDGGTVGGIDYETFNAASGRVAVHGVSIHPGSAKNIMKNAALIAMEFNSMLPANEVPAHTEGYEGFYHLTEMGGNEELAKLDYIIRDHSREKFEERKAYFTRVADYLNAKYGAGTVDAQVKDSYYNMREIVEQHMDIVERAEAAYRAVGVEPYTVPVRGGTDGCRLSFMGLPCPNISTGGMNGHGRLECVAVQDMDKMVDMMAALVSAK
jgi:tripeptide aminopeptidase